MTGYMTYGGARQLFPTAGGAGDVCSNPIFDTKMIHSAKLSMQSIDNQLAARGFESHSRLRKGRPKGLPFFADIHAFALCISELGSLCGGLEPLGGFRFFSADSRSVGRF